MELGEHDAGRSGGGVERRGEQARIVAVDGDDELVAVAAGNKPLGAHEVGERQELMVLGRFEVPERRFASGAAYLRGMGHGRVRALHGLDALQRQDTAPLPRVNSE